MVKHAGWQLNSWICYKQVAKIKKSKPTQKAYKVIWNENVNTMGEHYDAINKQNVNTAN